MYPLVSNPRMDLMTCFLFNPVPLSCLPKPLSNCVRLILSDHFENPTVLLKMKSRVFCSCGVRSYHQESMILGYIQKFRFISGGNPGNLFVSFVISRGRKKKGGCENHPSLPWMIATRRSVRRFPSV